MDDFSRMRIDGDLRTRSLADRTCIRCQAELVELALELHLESEVED